MRILITGAAGYIGTQLTHDLLQKGYKVRGQDNFLAGTLSNILPYISSSNFEFFKSNVLETIYSHDCDLIVNLAAIVGAPACDKHGKELTFSHNAGIPRFISLHFPNIPVLQVSTGSIYGFIPGGICTEESEINPVSSYAISKYEGEKEIQRSKNWLIYRLATAFGLSKNTVRTDLLINNLLEEALRDRKLDIYQGEFCRTFIHVRDISSAIIFGIENFEKMKNQVYNIGDEENNWTKKETAQFISKKTGCNLNFVESNQKDPDQRSYFCKYDKINSQGWKANISIEEGIEELIKYYRIKL